MSDSEVELPSEAAISQKLRDVVLSLHEAGDPDEITLKRVRARAEKELSLPNGFLKSSEWKDKSSSTITAAAVRTPVLVRITWIKLTSPRANYLNGPWRKRVKPPQYRSQNPSLQRRKPSRVLRAKARSEKRLHLRRRRKSGERATLMMTWTWTPRSQSLL